MGKGSPDEMWRAIVRVLSAIGLAVALGCDGNQSVGAVDVPTDSTGATTTFPATYSVTVSINPAVTHQVMQGFGGSMRIFSDPHLIGQIGSIDNALQITLPDQNAVLDSVYHTVGLTRVRATYQGFGTQPTPDAVPRRDWIFADGQIDLVKRAQAKGLTSWWISPLALEAWMNGSTVSEYADWAMGTIRYWRSQGAELSWYSIVNEPNAIGVSGPFLRDAVKLIGRQLVAEGFKTRLVIPDDINPQSAAALARTVLSDPEARQYVVAIASHLYDYPLSAMSSMTAVSAEYNVPLWMTEFSVKSDSPMAWASIVDRLISDYNVSAVDYLWGFFGDWDSAQLVAIHSTSRQFTSATITPTGYAMAQYARFVLPGAKRVDCQSSDTTIRASAFMLGGKMTIVALNEASGATNVRFTLGSAFGNSSLRLVRTSTGKSLNEEGSVPVTKGSFVVELPAGSISTLIQ